MNTTLHPLFVQAQAGDKAAYAELLKAICSIAQRFVLRKISDKGAVDDVVQEILISVHKALHSYDPARPCMPWLASIMHFRLNDFLRAHYRKANFVCVPIEEVEYFLAADVTESPLEYEYVNEAVRSLPEKQQHVLKSMYHEQLTVKETSEKLGMSVSAVKVSAHRAYKKLRTHLEEEA